MGLTWRQWLVALFFTGLIAYAALPELYYLATGRELTRRVIGL